MKHLALFLAFFGGIMLLYQVPKLIDHELATDTTTPDQVQARLDRLEQALKKNERALATALERLARRMESLENRLNQQLAGVSPRPTVEPRNPRVADARALQGK